MKLQGLHRTNPWMLMMTNQVVRMIHVARLCHHPRFDSLAGEQLLIPSFDVTGFVRMSILFCLSTFILVSCLCNIIFVPKYCCSVRPMGVSRISICWFVGIQFQLNKLSQIVKEYPAFYSRIIFHCNNYHQPVRDSSHKVEL